MGHEVEIVALVASTVERLFLRTLTKTVAVVAESRWTCTRRVIKDGCGRLVVASRREFCTRKDG